MRSGETDLQTQLLTQQLEVRANHWRFEILDQRSNYRRRNSNSVALRLKFRICEVRWSGINRPKLETQKIFNIEGKDIFPFGNSSTWEQQNWRQRVNEQLESP